MTRSGTVCLLGAGASAEAGYPLATELGRQFDELVEAEAKRDIELRRKLVPFELSLHHDRTVIPR